MTTPTRRGDVAVARRKAFLSNPHRLLDQAAATLGLSDAVATTAHDLINRIPEDAPAPISPAGVERLAAHLTAQRASSDAHSDGVLDFAGQVCLVTGSARGIGAAIARQLAARGARVVVHCKSNTEAARRTRAWRWSTPRPGDPSPCERSRSSAACSFCPRSSAASASS